MISAPVLPRHSSLSARLRRCNLGYRRAALAVLVLTVLVAPAQAQLPPLNQTETKNVEKVVANLDDLLSTVENSKMKFTAKSESGEQVEVGPEEVVKAYKEVLANLKRKLQGKNIHGVPGLNDPKPRKKYVVGDPNTQKPSNPRAAYCVQGTQVWDGTKWVPCPSGDILIDSKFTNPPENNGQAIDENTDAGWKQKWTLLHILVHEKWHERMINEQIELVKEANKGTWPTLPDDQKKKKTDLAQANGTAPEKHVEVYEAQKNILRLKRRVLEDKKKQLQKATPPDKTAIQRVEKQIDWLKKEVTALEDSMKHATTEHTEFQFASCGGAGDLRNGTVAIYVVSLTTGYWRLDVDLRDGKLVGLRAPETFFFGTLYQEDPVSIPPSLYVVMPRRIFTGLAVQPEPCMFLQWATQAGYVVRNRDFAEVQNHLPKLAPEAAPPAQATLVGVVLPTDTQQGEEVSGTVTTDPKRYEGIPALRVLQVEVPLPLDADGKPSLQSVLLTVGNEKPRPAQDGLTALLTPGTPKVSVRLNTSEGGRPLLDTAIPVNPPKVAEKPPVEMRPQDFTTPAVCTPNAVQVIYGSLSGDSRLTQVAVDDVPARIVAETPRAVYWFLPQEIQPGNHHVSLRDGSHGATFVVAVLSLEMSADRLTLKRGESTAFRAVVRGVEGLPPSAWRAAARSDLVDPTKLQSSAPGFRIPSAGEEGTLLLTLQNGSPGIITIPGWGNEFIVLTLHRENFSAGPYVYTGTIVSRVSGQFAVNGTLIPFLAEQSGLPLP